MGDHLVLYVDRLITPTTLQANQGISENTESSNLQPKMVTPASTSNERRIDESDMPGEDESLLLNAKLNVECRICQEEDDISNLETPCGCSGSLKAMRREASEFDYGAKAYYLVLISNMVVWQLMYIRRVGIIFCTSSLFAGVMNTTILPITQLAAVITFHGSFTAEKGMSLVLTLWGFTSYFYGSYKNKRQSQQQPLETREENEEENSVDSEQDTQSQSSCRL